MVWIANGRIDVFDVMMTSYARWADTYDLNTVHQGNQAHTPVDTRQLHCHTQCHWDNDHTLLYSLGHRNREDILRLLKNIVYYTGPEYIEDLARVVMEWSVGA